MEKAKAVAVKCRYNNRILNKHLVLLLSLLFFGCGTVNDDTSNQTDLEKLTKIEVAEYEGQDLSSLTDFRENTIKGPQYINSDAYTLTIDGLVEQPVALSYDEVLANAIKIAEDQSRNRERKSQERIGPSQFNNISASEKNDLQSQAHQKKQQPNDGHFLIGRFHVLTPIPVQIPPSRQMTRQSGHWFSKYDAYQR